MNTEYCITWITSYYISSAGYDLALMYHIYVVNGWNLEWILLKVEFMWSSKIVFVFAFIYLRDKVMYYKYVEMNILLTSSTMLHPFTICTIIINNNRQRTMPHDLIRPVNFPNSRFKVMRAQVAIVFVGRARC